MGKRPCPLCKGVGARPCPACQDPAKPAPRGVCPTCEGTGEVLCACEERRFRASALLLDAEDYQD